MVGWIDGVTTHMVQPLTGLFTGLVGTTRPLVIGMSEPPGAGILVYPPVGAAQVEYLPGLQHDGFSGVHAPHLDTLAKPPDNPVSPGSVEDIWKFLCTLALQVVQMALTGKNFIFTALCFQASPSHLLSIDRNWVMESTLPSSPQIDHRPDRPGPQRPPGPFSGQGAPVQMA